MAGNRLAGKTAIVTGGSRGMGEATVRAFVEQGAKVLIADILEEQGSALATELGEMARFCRLDVSNAENWKEVVVAANGMGSLQVLVNNAGIIIPNTIMDTSEAEYMKVVSINQLGVFLGMQAVFPSMKACGKGSIVNVSSIDGLQSKNGLCAYSATKWAVRGMTKAASIEMGRYGIRVNNVHPGGIYTAMHGSDFISQEQADASYVNQALPRVGLPHEVANLSLFLASDESSYSTGADFVADGGMHSSLFDKSLPVL